MSDSNKKGVELSINTMIIIVIALLVLIIVAFLIIKSAGNVNTQTGCDARGGTCVEKTADCPTDYIASPFGGCDAAKPKCCVKISKN